MTDPYDRRLVEAMGARRRAAVGRPKASARIRLGVSLVGLGARLIEGARTGMPTPRSVLRELLHDHVEAFEAVGAPVCEGGPRLGVRFVIGREE